MTAPLAIRPVQGKAGRAAFVEFPYRHYAHDPNWVPPLRTDAIKLLDPKHNAWMAHAEVQLFVGERDGRVVGRIAAHIDRLALQQPPEQGMGPGTGFWGFMDADNEADAHALIAAAEAWLKDRRTTHVLGPVSLSIWDEPGLLVSGFDHPPTVMMGHHDPRYRGWIEAAGYAQAKALHTYDLDITHPLPPLVQRIVAAGEKNGRIRVRCVDKRQFGRDAAIILGILNDAWSDNWGFVPLTEDEIVDVGKKLKPIVYEDLIMIAELEGEPVAFMMTLPDLNEAIGPLKGSLFPFGWAKLLWWLRKPQVRTMRVPLMGVVKRLQSSRIASQLAFMLIEYIRRAAIANYGATRSEFGWILEDNQGMRSIAETIDSRVNKEYVIFRKAL